MPIRKKGRRDINFHLPFPNFGISDNELPAVCHCVFDGEEFYVRNFNDMLTLYQNGAFGTSNLTNRGPSSIDRPPVAKFKAKMYHSNICEIYTTSNNGNLKIEEIAQTSITENNSSPPIPPPENDKEIPNNEKIDENGISGPKNEKNLEEDEVTDQETENTITITNNAMTNNTITKEKLQEKLILLPEEVIYLSFGVGCLSIQRETGETLSYQDIWEDCVMKDAEFPLRYAVYHYFRAKNWVPKLGINYGGQFVLYEGGPEINHSTYVIHILSSETKPTWIDIFTWLRVATSASKGVLLCNVMTGQDINSSPMCIFQMNIKETILCRWKPFKEEMNT